MLLLHGLGGHVGEWADTADGMKDRARVVAFDARGHGRSERRPEDVSREAHVADVAFVIEQLELGPVVVVGQSLGGVTALLVAAEHPELVRAGNGVVEPADAEEMCARAPDVRLVELVGAEHDLHLDRPEEWCQALTEFLDSLDDAAPDRDQ